MEIFTERLSFEEIEGTGYSNTAEITLDAPKSRSTTALTL